MKSEDAWPEAKSKFPVGPTVLGTVARVEPFGVFVDIPGCGVRALLEVPEFEDGPRAFDLGDYPQVGAAIRAVVVDHVEHNQQLRLSTIASRWRDPGRSPA